MLQYVEEHAKHPEEAKIVLAHTDGYGQWDDVENLLVGKHVYFDLAYNLGHIPDEQLLRIIENHGADQILFANRLPLERSKRRYCMLKSKRQTIPV